MTVIVTKQRVNTGERVYLSGETIVGLSEKDEQELVDLGVCRYAKEDKEPDDNQISDTSTKAGELPEGLEQVGGGVFLLPNGEKVRGKAKAIAALEAYNQELSDKELEEDEEESEESDTEGDPNTDGPNTDLPL